MNHLMTSLSIQDVVKYKQHNLYIYIVGCTQLPGPVTISQ